jgi:hypothetical protein
MKRLLKKTGWLFTVAVLCGAGGIVNSDETPRQFDIELLIFRNLVENDAGEIWPPDYSGWFDASAGAPDLPDAASDPLVVSWLPNETHRLADEYHALRRSAGYRPLAYLAWRQPVLDRDAARPLTAATEPHQRDGSYVDGTVTVAVERYLHLSLDLQLHLPGVVPGPRADNPDPANDEGNEAGETPTLPAIRLTEQRRVRSGELHYFDNPRFGVVALISPYEPPPETTPETAGTAAPATDDTPGDPAGTGHSESGL